MKLCSTLFNLKEENIMQATIYKTKSQVRQETSDALQQFLARGGQVEVVKARKAPKQKMSGKTTKSGSTGTSGFAMGFPTKSL
jgi:hypothetical protein